MEHLATLSITSRLALLDDLLRRQALAFAGLLDRRIEAIWRAANVPPLPSDKVAWVQRLIRYRRRLGVLLDWRVLSVAYSLTWICCVTLLAPAVSLVLRLAVMAAE